MRKLMSLLLAAVMVLSLAACAQKPAATEAATTAAATEAATEAPADVYVRPEIKTVQPRVSAPLAEEVAAGKTQVKDYKDITIGFIFLHDENSTYDRNFMEAAKAACAKYGVNYLEKVGIPETNECYEAACDLVDRKADLVFADSFSHESYLLQAAKEFPDVQFCHATGTMSHTEGVANLHNAFAHIYEGRYLAGIAAGMKLNQMIADGKITADQAKMGYVGAYTYAEVISGYTSFYLGAKSVCPSVTMEVQFTGSWYDEALEKEAAQTLLNNKCVLISQHADSMGAPTACEEAGVPDVSYNGSTLAACPNTFMVSSRINWQPYFEYIINCIAYGEPIVDDWCGTLDTTSVMLTEINEAVCAPGTREALDEAWAKLSKGEISVFDTNNFTVSNIVKSNDLSKALNKNAEADGSNKLTSYGADVDTDAAYTADTEAVQNGAFEESTFRSAPYFDIMIDGITTLNAMF
ncbi:MAG: BMP family ABC transporter substrate-binding protein [Lachnospiraceae bacterium]|nr:BMP family ABC transporter substrate-binding protein [Lachnospiraceae bacterium]